eukprot:gene7242-351_t
MSNKMENVNISEALCESSMLALIPIAKEAGLEIDFTCEYSNPNPNNISGSAPTHGGLMNDYFGTFIVTSSEGLKAFYAKVEEHAIEVFTIGSNNDNYMAVTFKGLKAITYEIEYPSVWKVSCCDDPPIVLTDSCNVASYSYGTWATGCPTCTAPVSPPTEPMESESPCYITMLMSDKMENENISKSLCESSMTALTNIADEADLDIEFTCEYSNPKPDNVDEATPTHGGLMNDYFGVFNITSSEDRRDLKAFYEKVEERSTSI